MSELVADCPRCGSKKITFDLQQEHLIATAHGWQNWYEAFCVCRHCHKSTVFVLSATGQPDIRFLHERNLSSIQDSVNALVKIERFISLRDIATAQPPEHVPPEIDAAFREGATCMAVECFNAGATMFRLCIDHATRALLPKNDVEGLTAKIRWSLGLRLAWLFENKHIPEGLKALSSCIKEDGNDGAHAGTLKKEDAEDIEEFTFALLERLYTEPERLRLANERRIARREKK